MITILRWLVAPHFVGTEPGGDGRGNGAFCEMDSCNQFAQNTARLAV